MNLDQLEGKWDQVKGQVREKWGRITDDDIDVIQGKREQFVGKLKERYGFTVEQADRELKAFMKDCNCSSNATPKAKAQANVAR